jgi:hypothetical protein
VNVGFKAFNHNAGQYKLIFQRNLGPFCDAMYEEHLKQTYIELESTVNDSIPYKTCPVKPKGYRVTNYAPKNLGDYLPQYVPGGERWMLNFYYEKNQEILGGWNIYALLRNNQSLLKYG